CDEVSNRVNIASPPAISVTLDQKQDETCNPGDDASIEVVANGGTPPFRYQLESEDSGGVISIRVPFQTTTTIFTGLDANNATTNVLYRVRVLDANDCPSDETIVINPPVPLGLNAIAPTLLTCSDSEDGTITATATGGQGPGTYFFMLTFPDGSQSGAIASTTDTFQWNDLKPGNYIVTVTDNLACEAVQDPVIINAPPAVTIDVTQGPITCLAPSPNPITVTAGGGTPGGYVFSSDGVTFVAGNISATVHEFTLPAGDYNFYVRDVNGCVSPASNTIPVRDPVPLQVALDSSNTFIVCFGEPTGSIDASVTGGLGNYGYRVTGTDYLGNAVTLPGPLATDTQTASFFGDLPAGTYNYTVTSGDCVDSVTPFEIRQPTEFIAQAFATPISCNGETDGTIRVAATGGTWPQYFYSLYNSAGNAVFTFIEDDSDGIDFEHTFTDLPADTYRVEVEDANGCPRTIIDIQIIEPAPILATVNATTPEDCAGDMNGTATLSITGGLPPTNPADPSYFWSIDGVTYQPVTDPANLFIDNLPGGTTTVFIRDSQNNANCQGAFNIDIEPGVNLAGELVPELVCPIFDYSDPTSPVMTSEEQYFVSFDIVEDSQGLGIIYTLNGINGTPNPPNNSNLTGNFEVIPGEYEGIMEYQGCTRTVDTIEILEYTPLAIPVAQMTNNPQDPNEYQIIASGGRPFENTPFYAFSFTMLEEGMTLDQLEPSDYTELDGNIFVIRQTADYVLRVVDADGCEVLTVQNLTYINIRIPNYFTPDSPNSTAEDRFWYPRQITPNIDDPFFFENMEVIVFDRYGRMLAEFKGDQQGWDGLYQGKQLPSGDYWYSIILNDVDNREFTGHFTLYR
ncbi:T9SS type B sorting domain-containing protein, partial [Aquimarina megaterium]|uniref:T9SS type B sorting domain-containing protein n=1 Tax=Aquimarina megaterium TaxID=1443666 RepID=UPI001268F8DA